MTPEEAIKVMYNLVLSIAEGDTESERRAIEIAVKALKKQMPKKPYQDDENGVHEKDYCPTCHRSLFPYDHHCRCGQAIDWTEWDEQKE